MENCGNEKVECGNGRREFLIKASVLAGGLVLSLSGAAQAQDKKDETAADETALKLDADSPLNKVGGFDTIETKTGKVIVFRPGENEFKACSAVCPHKGGPISYDETSKLLVCAWHGSQFDTNGKVLKGPARTSLPAFAAENEVVVNLTPKA